MDILEFILYYIGKAMFFWIIIELLSCLTIVKQIKNYIEEQKKSIFGILIQCSIIVTGIIIPICLIAFSITELKLLYTIIVILISLIPLFINIRFFGFMYFIHKITKNLDIDKIENK